MSFFRYAAFPTGLHSENGSPRQKSRRPTLPCVKPYFIHLRRNRGHIRCGHRVANSDWCPSRNVQSVILKEFPFGFILNSCLWVLNTTLASIIFCYEKNFSLNKQYRNMLMIVKAKSDEVIHHGDRRPAVRKDFAF